MEREDLNGIEIDDIQVYEPNGEITLFFICPNVPKKVFLHEILFYHKFEIRKKKDESGEYKTLWLYFPFFHYTKLLNPKKKIEEIKGYQNILNDEVEFINTMFINEDGEPRTSLRQKIPLS